MNGGGKEDVVVLDSDERKMWLCSIRMRGIVERPIILKPLVGESPWRRTVNLMQYWLVGSWETDALNAEQLGTKNMASEFGSLPVLD